MSFFTSTSRIRPLSKRMTFFYLSGVLFFLLVFLFLSVVIDVEKIYLKKYLADRNLENYVQKLVNSKQGLVYSHLERRIKFNLAKITNPECFALGSSRVMQMSLREDSWISKKCSSLSNLGVSGGTLEDLVIFSSVLEEREPLTIFLAIDPWMLKFNSGANWLENKEVFLNYTSSLGYSRENSNGSLFSKKFINAFSYDYVHASFDLLLAKGFESLPTFEVNPPKYAPFFNWREGYSQPVTLSDGSHVYANSYIKGTETRNQTNTKYRNYRIQHYLIDEEAVNLLFALSKRLSSSHKVYYVLPPFHPKGFVTENREFVDRINIVENRIRELASSLDINVYGSYFPGLSACDEGDFFDMIHPSFDCIQNLKYQDTVTK